jgi:hypothetical protein
MGLRIELFLHEVTLGRVGIVLKELSARRTNGGRLCVRGFRPAPVGLGAH